MKKVLFVCAGNICRSQMAEAIMRYKVSEDEYYIDSAGTYNGEHGSPMYYLAQEKLREYGIPIGNHTARQIRQADYQEFDYILGMDSNNIIRMINFFKGDPNNKIRKLLSYAGESRDVEDPYYTRDFQKAYEDIVKGIDAFIKSVE